MGGFPSGSIPYSAMENVFFQFIQIFSQFILKILGNKISQSFMLSLKCDHPFLCKFPILFSTVKLKLGHKFPQYIDRFKIWVLKCLT